MGCGVGRDPARRLQASRLHQGAAIANPKRTAYVLKSVLEPTRYYTGVTSDITARLAAHNAGHCGHTVDGRPWKLDVAIRFADEQRALSSSAVSNLDRAPRSRSASRDRVSSDDRASGRDSLWPP